MDIERLRKNGILHTILVEGFYPFHVLTPELLARAVGYKPGSHTTVHTYLKIMEKANYVVHDIIPTKQYKRPYVYAIGIKGKDYLEKECGLEVLRYYKPSELDRLETPTIWHMLELNKFLVEASIIHKFAPLVPHIDFDPHEGMIEQELPAVFLHNMEHDFSFQRNPIVTSSKQGETIDKNPDAIVEFRIRLPHKTQKHRKLFWVELERTRKTPETIRRKVLHFLELRDNGIISKRYGGAWDIDWCLISTMSNDYLENLRQIIRDTIVDTYLEQEHAKKNKLLHFATMPPFQSDFVDADILFLNPYWLHPFGLKTDRHTLVDLTEQ